MLDRFQPPQPDPRLEEIDEALIRHHAPGVEEQLVAGRVFEHSRAHLARPGRERPLRLAASDEDGPSMLPMRSWSAWPVLAAMAALVALATVVAVLFSVQSARNNIAIEPSEQAEYLAIDEDFESEFTVATSALLSDISASVDSLVTTGDDWAYGSLSDELQIAATSLWEEMSSF